MVVDVSDTTMAVSGTNKKMTRTELITGLGIPTALDNLSDVTITTPSNGQVLKFNGSAWINDTDATGGGGGALDDLTDVTITAAATGDLLRYNGSAWVDYADSNYAAASHTQASTTITDFAEAVDDRVSSLLVAGTDIDLTYDDPNGTLTIAVESVLDANGRVAVEKAGTLVGTRRTLNFIEGSNVTLTIADDSGNEEVDITIAASGGGGSFDPQAGNFVVAVHVFG